MYKKQDDLFAHLIDKPLYKYHSMERLFLKFCIRIQNEYYGDFYTTCPE